MSDRPAPDLPRLQFVVDGRQVEVIDTGFSLLAALRGQLGSRSPKAGCNPQGQCGCCTVLVDGSPRVACVTPARRVAGRTITTVDGLSDEERAQWSEAFLATGASQCGFCTPGIICRLEGLRAKGTGVDDRAAVDRALAAHLCRCTGWQTIGEAWELALGGAPGVEVPLPGSRDLAAASLRATLEGHAPQRVDADIALGRGGFAEDTAPAGALVAMPRADALHPDDPSQWAVAASVPEARALAGKIQGRHGTVEAQPPLELPPGDWDLTLRTSWVEPAYLETDASWCEPGGEPVPATANGGAFGGKRSTMVGEIARQLAEVHGRPVRAVLSREDVVRLGPKRPPIAAGLRADGSGVIRVVRTPGVADAIRAVLPDVEIEEVDIPGPSTSMELRGAGWAEAAVLRAVLDARAAATDGPEPVVSVLAPNGARAEARIGSDGTVRVSLRCGRLLDGVVLRSYVIGAAHMALGWVRSEGLAVDADGVIGDLTIRSFGVLRSADMPMVEVTLQVEDAEPVNGSDAVFAAVAAAAWLADGLLTDWPTGAASRAGQRSSPMTVQP
jgi:aerobic-type carbon monoxide dehydrogenase small subunit (CoxS/CutS family)